KEYIIASAPYKDGGFTLNLPATIDDKYLNDWENGAKGEDIEHGIAAYKSGKQVGTFWFGDKIQSESTKGIIWGYANKAYTSSTGLLVKQGWSLLYWTKDGSEYEYTATQPGEMKWFFVPTAPDLGGAGSLEIKASNVSTGTVEVDSVKVVFWSNKEEYVIASAPYNGGFTLNLPATVDDGYLDDWENSVKFIEAYKNGSYVGQFWYADKIDPEPTKWTVWMYANKADEIEGLLVKQG
ncbi:hypothetical protein, partial [Candidatus Symbiothrix dinenymphae]|uniref:hypothetical protein n=1 Tax=Candidatus Symbiothrix dinenymphae TaxID=467085 RepID=UPI00131539D4